MTGYQLRSRHTDGNSVLFGVEGRHLNASCTLPGSPFAEGLRLVPNGPGEEPPTVTLGPLEGDAIDAITAVFVSPSEPADGGGVTVRARVLDSGSRALAESQLTLSSGARGALTLRFQRADDAAVHLCLDVSPTDAEPALSRHSVAMYYLAAFSDSELMRLCNGSGSDKGSEVFWGDGFPHFYALAYERLLSAYRQQQFNFLEIGLDAATYAGGQPLDAPSLRVWREFFPNATLYGYDLHDFSLFEQPGTHVFQGDQSSRADIARFLDAAGMPRFRLVIDDGSHAASHQQISLAALFDQLEPEGIYIIEDLDWQPFEEAPTTRDVLHHFMRHGRIESPFISDSEARMLEASIAEVDLCRPNDSEFAVVRKKRAPRGLSSLTRRLRRRG